MLLREDSRVVARVSHQHLLLLGHALAGAQAQEVLPEAGARSAPEAGIRGDGLCEVDGCM
jgi:hypothetical protein